MMKLLIGISEEESVFMQHEVLSVSESGDNHASVFLRKSPFIPDWNDPYSYYILAGAHMTRRCSA